MIEIARTEYENSDMKAFTQSGEKVIVTGETRNIGHGTQAQVIYSDGTCGWEHIEDLNV